MRWTIPLLLSLSLFAGCDLFSTTSSPSTPQWSASGLKGRDVWALQTHDQQLYAATDSGLYRRSLSANAEWTLDGLAGQWVVAIAWRSDETLLAGVRHPGNNSETASILYKRGPTPGAEWVPFDTGYGPEEHRTIRGLTAVPGARDTLFARGSQHVARSTDGGAHWELVWGDWSEIGYQAPLIYVSPHDPSLVFAGGESSIFQPYLVRSPNRGTAWSHTGPLVEDGDNAVYSIIEHPKKPNHFLLGLEGHVLRSTDGGQSWTTNYEPPTYTYVYDFAAQSTPNQTVIYAAGSENGTQAGPLTLHRTENFGDSWDRIDYPGGPDSTVIRTLAYTEAHDRDRLYLGTLNGVYVYRP